jgi:hypothetical protein
MVGITHTSSVSGTITDKTMCRHYYNLWAADDSNLALSEKNTTLIGSAIEVAPETNKHIFLPFLFGGLF